MKNKKRSISNSSDRSIKARLKAWVHEANKRDTITGVAWYSEAQQFVKDTAAQFDLEPYIVAAVTSALSPNNKWQRNKQDSFALIAAYCQGETMESVSVCTYNANKRKAWGILKHGRRIASKSPKTHAFAMNIGELSADHVTVDKWHMRACLLTPKMGIKEVVESPTSAQYRRIEAITASIAREEGLKGFELQAIIWVTIKRKWNR